jgi:hypothetical protein
MRRRHVCACLVDMRALMPQRLMTLRLTLLRLDQYFIHQGHQKKTQKFLDVLLDVILGPHAREDFRTYHDY